MVQTELGITGAREKSAWGNFVTGLADENADLKQLANEVVDSAMTAVDNLLPVVGTIIESLVDMIPVFTDKLMELMPEAVAFLTEQLPTFIEYISIVTSIIEGLVQAMPVLIESGIQITV